MKQQVATRLSFVTNEGFIGVIIILISLFFYPHQKGFSQEGSESSLAQPIEQEQGLIVDLDLINQRADETRRKLAHEGIMTDEGSANLSDPRVEKIKTFLNWLAENNQNIRISMTEVSVSAEQLDGDLAGIEWLQEIPLELRQSTLAEARELYQIERQNWGDIGDIDEADFLPITLRLVNDSAFRELWNDFLRTLGDASGIDNQREDGFLLMPRISREYIYDPDDNVIGVESSFDSLWEATLNTLTQEEILRLVSLPTRIDDEEENRLDEERLEYGDSSEAVLTPAGFLFNAFEIDRLSIIQSSNRLPLLRKMITATKEKIYYDGVNHRHVYPAGSEVEALVSYFAELVWKNEEEFKELVQQLSPEERNLLILDSNTDNPATRVETFDLLSSKLKEFVLDRSDLKFDSQGEQVSINPIQLTSLSKSRLKSILGIPLQQGDLPIAILRDPASNQVSFICGLGSQIIISNVPMMQSSEDDDYSSDESSYLTIKKVLIPSDVSADQIAIAWQCGSKLFHVRLEGGLSEGEIPFPPQFNFSTAEEEGTLRALASFAITDHFSRESLNLFLIYMTLRDYRATSVDSVDDTRDKFEIDFLNTDFYFPTAHSLDLMNFQLGSENSTRVVLTKNATENGKKVELVIYFPRVDGVDGNQLYLTQDDLQKLLCERRDVRNNPLAVVTMSCNSEGSLHGWMNAYRKSVVDDEGTPKVDLAQLADVPIVIGAKRGFSTDSAVDLMGHMEYALSTLDLASSAGAGVEDILNRLRTPNDLEKFKLIVREMPKQEKSNAASERTDVHGYNPVCNTDPAFRDLFSLSGFIQIMAKDALDPAFEYAF